LLSAIPYVGKCRISVAVTVAVPLNISAPEFIGPIVTDSDYFFVCRVVYTGILQVNFDVTLTFDGRQRSDVVVKTVSSASSLDVVFTPTDFGGQFGSMVCHRTVCLWTDQEKCSVYFLSNAL